MPLTPQTHAPLKTLNTLGICATAQNLYTVESLADLREALQQTTNQPRLILGGGSNIILQGDYAGAVILMQTKGVRVTQEDEDCVWVEAQAGEPWHPFVLHTLAQGWYGLENLSLIPGTVGACPIQNVGAYGVEVKDYFAHLEALHIATGEIHTFNTEACQFAYRESVFKQALAGQYIILSVTFKLNKTPKLHTQYGEIAQILQAAGITHPTPLDVSRAVCQARQRKLPDPAVLGNAGSFFKNPIVSSATLHILLAQYPQMPHYRLEDGQVKLAAGWLIEQAGWKGKQLGVVGMYEKQALVLVNHGGATGKDVLATAQAVQQSVQARFNINLEIEPILV